MYLGPAPKWPVPQAGHLGLTWVSPWNDAKAIRTYRGQTGVDPGEANQTHPLSDSKESNSPPPSLCLPQFSRRELMTYPTAVKRLWMCLRRHRSTVLAETEWMLSFCRIVPRPSTGSSVSILSERKIMQLDTVYNSYCDSSSLVYKRLPIDLHFKATAVVVCFG